MPRALSVAIGALADDRTSGQRRARLDHPTELLEERAPFGPRQEPEQTGAHLGCSLHPRDCGAPLVRELDPEVDDPSRVAADRREDAEGVQQVLDRGMEPLLALEELLLRPALIGQILDHRDRLDQLALDVIKRDGGDARDDVTAVGPTSNDLVTDELPRGSQSLPHQLEVLGGSLQRNGKRLPQ
jgi:hypothetical protein